MLLSASYLLRQSPSHESPIWEAFYGIEKGTPESEVDALLGIPESTATGGDFGCCGVQSLSSVGGARKKVWRYDDRRMMIAFDGGGFVVAKTWDLDRRSATKSEQVEYYVRQELQSFFRWLKKKK
jgi:hypothetical protein